MTIEEKAIRYDEVKNKLSRFIAQGVDPLITRADVQDFFPELAESKDEKIRKEIISFLQLPHSQFVGERKQEKWIAWLEKQEIFGKKDVDDAYLKGVRDTKNEIEKQYEANYQTRKDIATFIFNYRGDIKDRAKWMDYLGIKVSFVGEQGEQKPTDTVEPKFKVGDWIVRGKTIAQILDIQEQYYVGLDIDGKDFTSSRFLNDDKIHLWTIQDAKDGDVLICKGNIKNSNGIKYERICLFNNLDNAFFTLTKTSNFVEEYNIDVNIDYPDNTVPATKEQKEILFMAMAGAGYTFDFEKKELKKIISEKQIKKNLQDNSFRRMFEQKPTWKPSDEQMEAMDTLIVNLDRNPLLLDNFAQANLRTLHDDLKKLKENKL